MNEIIIEDNRNIINHNFYNIVSGIKDNKYSMSKYLVVFKFNFRICFINDKNCDCGDKNYISIYDIFNVLILSICKNCIIKNKEHFYKFSSRYCNYIETQCQTASSYGFINQTTRIFCSTHAPKNFINVKHKYMQCCNIILQNNLKIQCPTFGNYKSKEGELIFCSKCKPNNTIMINRKCQYEFCVKTATFGKENKAEFCKDHIPKQYLTLYKDAVHPKCNLCDSNAIFYEANDISNIFCKKHKTNDCLRLGGCANCKQKVASFTYDNSLKYCASCKPNSNFKNLNANFCLESGCQTTVNTRLFNLGYCIKHFCEKYPDLKKNQNYRFKEKEVIKILPDNWTFNSIISGGSSCKRPDAFIRYKDFAIIVEIDEFQHSNYCAEDEKKRQEEIQNDFGIDFPVITIRFNPDSYFSSDRKKIKSPFKIDNAGIMYIADVADWNNRLETLKSKIDFITQECEKNTLSQVIHLFYDC